MYRLIFLAITVLVIPLVPVAIIFLGVSSPEYVIKGTLNLDLSQTQTPSYLDIYVTFLKNILHLNLGKSVSSGKPVINIVCLDLLTSFTIIIPSIIFSYIVGTIIGVATEKSNLLNIIYYKVRFVFFVPIIILAYLLLYLLNAMGSSVFSNIKYLAAILALSAYPIYVISISLKKTIHNLKESNFFVFHKSMGLSHTFTWRTFCKEIIAVEYLSYFENIIIYMLGFLYFVEVPFGINGMGYRFVSSIHRFDYPIIIGFCIFAILILSFINVLVDLLKLKLDPRLAI